MPEQVDYSRGWRLAAGRLFVAAGWVLVAILAVILVVLLGLGVWWLGGPGTDSPW